MFCWVFLLSSRSNLQLHHPQTVSRISLLREIHQFEKKKNKKQEQKKKKKKQEPERFSSSSRGDRRTLIPPSWKSGGSTG